MEDFKLDVVSVRLVKDAPVLSDIPVNTPEAAIAAVGNVLSEMDREVVCIINLKTDNTPINCNFVSMGALDMSIVEPREIFKSAILSNAAKMIMVHNHPSGNIIPSKTDTIITDRLVQLCNMMNIPLLDHVIIGANNEYFSFRECNKINCKTQQWEMDYHNIQFTK